MLLLMWVTLWLVVPLICGLVFWELFEHSSGESRIFSLHQQEAFVFDASFFDYKCGALLAAVKDIWHE